MDKYDMAVVDNMQDPIRPGGRDGATEVVIVDVQPGSTLQQEGCKLFCCPTLCNFCD